MLKEFNKDYFNSLPANSIQSALYKIISQVIGKEKGKHVFILSHPLIELSKYAEEEKASSEYSKLLPFEGVKFSNHIETTAKVVSFKKICTEGIWTFKLPDVVCAGNIIFLQADYEETGWSCGSFIICDSEQIAKQFIENYYTAKWKRNSGPRVLDHYGHIIESFRKMQWEEIFLPNNMVETIRSEINTFFKSEKQYAEHGIDWKRGIMLAGKPGGGKTCLARAIATTSDVPVIYCCLDDSDVFRTLNRVDKTIRSNSPCIVVFEDADSLATNPQARSNILNLLDGLLSVSGVLTIATTNTPEKLDEAFTGRPSRFDSFYILDDPPMAERKKIFMAKLKGSVSDIPAEELEELLKEMSGLSAASVQEVAVCALLSTFKTGKPIDIKILKEAVQKVKKHMKTSGSGMQKLSRGSIGFGHTKTDEYDSDF